MAGSNNYHFPDEGATYIWLGRFQFQSFLSQWLASNSLPKTHLAHLKESYTRLVSKDLSFANLCRYLSLHFPFPECGGSAEEELYRFLGKVSLDRDRKQIDSIQQKISEYLKKLPLHYLNATTNNPMFIPTENEGHPSHGRSTENSSATASPRESKGQVYNDLTASTTGEPATSPSEYSSTEPPKEGVPLFSAIPTAVPVAMKSDPVDISSNSAATGTSTVTFSRDAQCTVRLKEKGDREGAVAKYEGIFERENPPIWRVVATYGNTVGIGRDSAKRNAKHLASREVLAKLGETV